MAEVTVDTESISEAGLVYVNDTMVGITRSKGDSGFTYAKTDGQKIEDLKILERIKKLAIPPAWENVWICAKANGYLQATGKDIKGRKQYRYHAKWGITRGDKKFSRMIAFGRSLPKIRTRVDELMSGKELSKEQILSLLINILDKTLIRIGNREYAKSNKSFGLTTLRNKHLKTEKNDMVFDFVGKKGIRQLISIDDRKAIRLIKKCKDLPGYDLFQYIDIEGNLHVVTSSEVNLFIKDISGAEFTAKDFRTWGGTAHALSYILHELGPLSEINSKKLPIDICKHVAKKLGNTPSVCKAHYIHPHLFNLIDDIPAIIAVNQKIAKKASIKNDLSIEEKVLMHLLRKQLQKERSA